MADKIILILKKYKVLITLTLLFHTILFFRFILADKLTFSFLAWNVFLALLPILFAEVFVYFDSRLKNNLSKLNYFFLASWLFFFPNSPYLLTDTIHLYVYSNRSVSYWFDVIMFQLLFILGLYTSTASLSIIANRFTGLFDRFYKVFAFWLVVCFGIYLGREIRLNSWDLLNLENFYSLLSGFDFRWADFWPFMTIWPLVLTVYSWYVLRMRTEGYHFLPESSLNSNNRLSSEGNI